MRLVQYVGAVVIRFGMLALLIAAVLVLALFALPFVVAGALLVRKGAPLGEL